jgi:DNA repair exonuclease SbcCD ATPase subunit
MLEMLEKLINEHGSSTILRERLELFSDKYSMLEEKNKHLEERNKDLESTLSEAKKEIERLEKTVQANSNTGEKIHKNEEKILKYLFDTNSSFFASHLAGHFSIPIGHVEYHLTNLEDLDYVHGNYAAMVDTSYEIADKGRKYIVENGI